MDNPQLEEAVDMWEGQAALGQPLGPGQTEEMVQQEPHEGQQGLMTSPTGGEEQLTTPQKAGKQLYGEGLWVSVGSKKSLS